MGEFWKSIETELEEIDRGIHGATFGGEAPAVTYRASGSALQGSALQGHPLFQRRTHFGVDYDSNTDVVRQAQTAINALGYSPALSEDGAYGPMTQAGIQWAQGQKGLTQDGILGASTLQALGIAVPAVQPLARTTAPAIDGLKPDVAAIFPAFSIKYEGNTPFMYTDSKGLVTTGIGNLIDPQGAAMGLPWKNSDGSAASQADIAAAWNTVKNAYPGVQSVASQSLTTIRLDPDGVAQLVDSKLASFVSVLRSEFSNFDSLPAAAQLALCSISWAWGPAFPKVWGTNGDAFIQAIQSNDFASASNIMMTASAHEESINPGIVPRDAANRDLFAEAASTTNPDVVAWPAPVGSGGLMAMASSPLAIFAALKQKIHNLPTTLQNLPATIKANPKAAIGIGAIVVAAISGLVYLILHARGQGHAALPPARKS